jgi:uracil-DNA glycosylase family 4
VKCFPSKTEAPKKQHINICSYNWLKEQTTIINPQIILVLGGIASEFISGDKIKIIEYSGHCEYNHTYNCWIVYSVHPSWLTPPKKKIFQKALKIFSDKMRSL